MKTIFVSLILCGVAFGATGTISAVAIEGTTGCAAAPACNGGVADITITTVGTVTAGTYPTASLGLGANNNPLTGTPMLVFTVLSKILGTSTTGTRIVYGVPTKTVIGLRKPYPNNAVADETPTSNQVVVRIALSDYIYSGDTVTAVIAAAFYRDSNSASNLSYSGSVTNNSTQAYSAMPPVCRWVTVPYQRITAAFSVEASCFHRFAQQGRPVYQVVFTCTDGTNTATSTANFDTISSSLAADQNPVIVYVGNFNASSFIQADVVTCNFSAYPWVGDSTAVLSSSSTAGPIYSAAVNAGGSGYAVNDTGLISGAGANAVYKVSTVSGSAVTAVTISYGGTGYSTTTGNATSVSTGGGNGSLTLNTTVQNGVAGTEALGPLVFLNDKSGTYGVACAVIDPTNGHNSTANTWVAASCATAEANYVSSTGNSYTTIGNAVQACKSFNNANNSHNDPGGCTVELATNSNIYPGTTPGGSQGAMNTWFTITKLSTVTVANAAITSGTIADLNTALVHFQNITVSGSSTYLYSGGTSDRVWADGLAINTSTISTNFYVWGQGYATGNKITAMTSAGFGPTGSNKMPFALIRGNYYSSASHNAGIAASQYAIVGNYGIWPSYQKSNNSPKSSSSDGSIVAFNSFYNWYNSGALGAVSGSSDVTPITAGIAIVQNVAECESNNSATAPCMEVQDASTVGTSPVPNGNGNNIMLWYNTMMGARIDQLYNYQQSNTGPLYMFNMSQIGNIWDSYNYNGDTSLPVQANNYGNIMVDYSLGQKGNVKRWNNNGSSSPSWCGVFIGIFSPAAGCASSSTGYTISFVNDASYNLGNGGSGGGNGNYRLQSGTGGTNIMPDCFIAYDFQGQVRNCSGWGSAGAYEQSIIQTKVFDW